jgi:hypothetical protein
MVAMLELRLEIFFLVCSLVLSKAMIQLSKSWFQMWAIGE